MTKSLNTTSARHETLAVALIGAVPALFLSKDCYAYIDPNAGGLLFQLLFPLLVAVGGIWSLFWRRIQAMWARVFRRKVNDD